MDISIDHDSAVPPFEQVRLRIAELAATGRLAAGHRLPPVRTLATDLGLAANTVARAYKELEALGVVETRGRAGTFVSGSGVQRSLREAASSYVASARSLGLTDDAALDAVRRALRS